MVIKYFGGIRDVILIICGNYWGEYMSRVDLVG